MTNKTKIHYCCQCCLGGNYDVPADYYVTGKIINYTSGRSRPFRGYICDGHLTVLTDDGAELHIRSLGTMRADREDDE